MVPRSITFEGKGDVTFLTCFFLSPPPCPFCYTTTNISLNEAGERGGCRSRMTSTFLHCANHPHRAQNHKSKPAIGDDLRLPMMSFPLYRCNCAIGFLPLGATCYDELACRLIKCKEKLYPSLMWQFAFYTCPLSVSSPLKMNHIIRKMEE